MPFKSLITSAILILGMSSVFAQNSTMASNQKDENQKNFVNQADKKGLDKIDPNSLLPSLSMPKEIVVKKDIDAKNQESTLWDSFWKLPRQERIGIMAIFGVSLLIIFGVTKHFLSRKKPQ